MPTLPAFSICPFRSPVFPPKESALAAVTANGAPIPSEPQQVLAPCLYAGCGLFKITKVVDGQIVDGMCGIRFLAEVGNSIAMSLEQIVKIGLSREAREGVSPLFGTAHIQADG